MSEKIDAFLKELNALTRKHGVTIGGCGCLGSPYMSEDGADDGGHYVHDDGENLTWVSGRVLAGRAAAESLTALLPVHAGDYRFNESWFVLEPKSFEHGGAYIGFTAEKVLHPCRLGRLDRATLDRLAEAIGGTVGDAMTVEEWESKG